MKTRNGFVSNSSTSSFICNVCGEEFSGYDASPSEFDCCTCENEHIMCNDHFKDVKIEPVTIEGCEHTYDRTKAKFCPECGKEAWKDEDEDYGNELPAKYCPICQFKIYANDEMAKYLEKTRKISRDEAFAEVKKVNKRRRKLYDEEYITHVCQKFSLTDEILLKEVKEKFNNDFDKYAKFVRGY
jgi:hypothetical protein